MTIIIPPPITKPWCNSGDSVAPPVGANSTVANQETGIPPLQATKLSLGGFPVRIEEFNGFLKLYSQQIQALVSGVKFTFDQAVSDENGGYPIGIILYCDSNNSFQKSLKNNNTANFVTNPSYINDNVNWISTQDIFNLTSEHITSKDLKMVEGSAISFYNSGDSNRVTLKADPALTVNSDYELPSALPTTSGMMKQCRTDGKESWNWASGNPAGVAPQPGYIGENFIVENSIGGLPDDEYRIIIALELQPGSWMVGVCANASNNDPVGTAVGKMSVIITTDSTSFTPLSFASASIHVNELATLSPPLTPINVDTPTHVYFAVYPQDMISSTCQGYISAFRCG